MKRYILHMLFFLLMGGVTTQAQFFVDGNKLLEWSQAHEKMVAPGVTTDHIDFSKSYLLQGYVQGVYDSFSGGICAPDGVTVGQLCAIVSKYLKEHPENWHLAGDLIVLTALRQAFPCKK